MRRYSTGQVTLDDEFICENLLQLVEVFFIVIGAVYSFLYHILLGTLSFNRVNDLKGPD